MGRTEELAALEDAFDAAADGLVVLLIAGDPGVGKTSLAEVFTDGLQARGVPVHWGSCAEIGGAPAFWPWIQVLRSIGDDALDAAQEGLAARVDEPFAAYDAVYEALRHRSDETRVLVLDNLHAADLPSLQLLRFLAGTARELPILIIGTHRIHELRTDRARDAALAAVAASGRRLVPSTLGLVEVRALLGSEGVTEGDGDGAIAVEVLARSGGNALYVEQLVAAVGRGGSAGLADIPSGIRAAVRARLEPLPEATRELLALASVLGPGFRPEVLAAVAGRTVTRVRDELAPAFAAGVVAATGDEIAFTHALVQDTLDDELGPVDRSTAHAAAAATLAGRGEDVPAAVIAQHLLDAGALSDPAEVARWAERSAHAARRLSGHREAARWSEQAARHWGRHGDFEAQGNQLAQAISDLVTVGDGVSALAISADLAGLARRSDSGSLLAKAALARSEVFEAQDLDSPPLIVEALAHRDLQDRPELQADLLAALASLLGMPSIDGSRRDVVAARGAIGRLEAMAAAGDARSQGRLAEARLNVESGPLHHRDRHGWLADYQRLIPDGHNALIRVQHLYWATSLAFEAGELLEVDRLLREWEVLAERSDSTFWRWRAAMARASLSFAQGRFDTAERQATVRGDLVANLHPDMAIRVVGGLVFAVRREQGRLQELARLPGASLGLLGLVVAADQGDVAELRRLLPIAIGAADNLGPDDLAWFCIMSAIASVVEMTEDPVLCAWVADQLDPYMGQCVMWGRSYVFGMPVSEAVGWGRRGAGQLAEAAVAFRQELAWADRVGAPGFGARARVGLASVLPAGDPERVRLASQALVLASRLGMILIAAEAERVLGGESATDQAAGTAVFASGSEGSEAAASARVRTLGRFEVVGAGMSEPVRWSSRKARDALKILISRRGQSIAREELVDLLWPDVDLPTGRGRLSVILSMVRGALDPQKQFPSDPLRADRQAVGLDLNLVSVDVEEFLAHAAKGLRVGTLADPDPDELRVAAGLADQGSFLAEDPYAEFALGLRSTVERTRRDVLRALAHQGVAEGDLEAATGWWAILVEIDPDDEAAYLELLALLERQGRHGEITDVRAAHSARAWGGQS